MARFLAIDWDHKLLQIVSATIGKGAAKIQQAVALLEEQSPNPAETEALGQLLKQRLKESGIAPAPVLFCLGRDRVIVKEVRYPVVPDHEEPAVVRFQAVKEITDAPEEVVIDYARVGTEEQTGERRALVVIVRRELLTMYQNICQAAGLKLAAVTPRPFGLSACLQDTLAQGGSGEAPDAAVGLLTLTPNWAEFCVVRNGHLTFARSVAPGGNISGEVRRNLSVYNGQSPGNPLRSLYIAGATTHAELREKLHESLGIPVHWLDPFGGVERPELPVANRGAFAGSVGLLHLRGQMPEMPINFAQPKQPKPPTDPRRRLYILGGVAAAVFLLVGSMFAYSKLSAKSEEISDLTARKTELEKKIQFLQDDDKRVKAIGAWVESEVVWLDEFYDLVDRFSQADPDRDSIRLASFSGSVQDRGGVKDKQHVAKMELKVLTTDNRSHVNSLLDEFIRDKFKPKPVATGRNTGVERQRFAYQATETVEFEPRTADKYVRKITVPDETQNTRSRRGQGQRGGTGAFSNFPGVE